MTRRPGKRCSCRNCVLSGSNALLSWYLRKEHERKFGLAIQQPQDPKAELEDDDGPDLIDHDQELGTGADGSTTQVPDHNELIFEDHGVVLANSEGFQASELETLSSGLLRWYRRSRGLPVTRQRMDTLLEILRGLQPGLPKQIRTIEARRQWANNLEFTTNHLARSIVCGNCCLAELRIPVSKCEDSILQSFA